ncbi:hypothetical protein [Streptomyces sp. NPDC007905]|uniref:hypothetical protein n=1 Tax=Streptomyces sp. NPDC007905 TaxID=3364788 RepID=UPI0036E2513E
MRQTPSSGGSEPTAAGRDTLHAAAGIVGQPEIPLGLRSVIRGQFDQAVREQPRFKDGGEPTDCAFPVFVLAPDDGTECFHQGIRSSPHAPRRRGIGGGEHQRFPEQRSKIPPCHGSP